MIALTQVLPNGSAQTVFANIDLIERIYPWREGSHLIFTSGGEMDVSEKPEEIAKKAV